jgi:hypothetical protein
MPDMYLIVHGDFKMVKSPSERSDKYNAKFDAEVVRSRYTAVSTLAKEKALAHQTAMANIAASVRATLNAAGEYPITTVFYQSFANKLYGLCSKFAGYPGTPTESDAAKAVALLEIARWKDMGAKDEILQDIWNIFSDCLGSAPSPVP